MTEARSDYRVALCTRELGEADLGRCVTTIRAGGAVDVDSTKLRAATALALAKNGDEIVGVGSMKPVRTGYATCIAKKIGFEFPSETQELGYIAVDAPQRERDCPIGSLPNFLGAGRADSSRPPTIGS